MTMGKFDMVKETALQMDKWLLVNLQRDSEFNSHILNRDFWRDTGVKDMVQCSFVFWQQLDVSDEGYQFISRYNVVEFPHVSIIDPRTGAVVWKQVGDLDCRLLAEKIQDFLGSSPNPSEYRGNKIRRVIHDSNSETTTPVTRTTIQGDHSSSMVKKVFTADDIVDLVEDDEEEQQAIRLSLDNKLEILLHSNPLPVLLLKLSNLHHLLHSLHRRRHQQSYFLDFRSTSRQPIRVMLYQIAL